MDIIGRSHDVRFLNVHPSAPDHDSALKELFCCDFLLVKSNFGWIPDRAYMKRAANSWRRPPVGLMISGSVPPRSIDLKRFEVLFYETYWYREFVASHGLAVHAFGVDTDVMHPRGAGNRDIDWLMVGRVAAFKHPEALLNQTGKRLIVGEIHDAGRTVERLRRDGITVQDFVPYDELAELYRRTRTLLVAAELQGGGERAILEARACGAEVRLTVDNPKPQEVAVGPIYDQHYYADQLIRGIELALAKQPGWHSRTYAIRRLAGDRVRGLPRFVRLRARQLRQGLVGLMRGRDGRSAGVAG